ncbi:cocosin 1-like [Typha angustifolia]|uniref:cocosin 1-like n=1 Tax=Typha angustifolia TaxID=59011 RepID=UPI003C2AAFDB
MAMSTSSWLPFSLCFLVLCNVSLAQLGYSQGQQWQSQRRLGSESQCRIERINAQEPSRRVQSEAGVTEYFDQNDEQFQCAGVAAFRRVIEPKGLLLPSFSNAPRLIYIIQGRGIIGTVIPGCPESFQSSFQEQFERRRGESEGQGQQRDEHQKIHHFRGGDIIALPAGIAHWCYNNGDKPVVAITVLDTSNNANQLDRNHREFLLAGRQKKSVRAGQQEQGSSGNNILSGFDTELLAEALGVNRDLARRIQSQDDERGEIVRVEQGLKVLRPSRSEERYEEMQHGSIGSNGLDEALCSMRIRENIGDPSRADVYTPQGGRLTTLNSQKLPILNFIQMSADRVVLNRNAMVAPHWNINAHSIMYVTGGRGRCQIVSNRGQTVFDGELRQGQLIIVPQNFAVIKRAESDGFEWVSFKTNGNAMVSEIVGKASALRGMPEDVLANSYRISREEARRLKFNRGYELGIFSPKSTQGGRSSAA